MIKKNYTRESVFIFFLYCLCIFLVLVFVNLYSLFEYSRTVFGDNTIVIVPIIAPITILLGTIFLFRKKINLFSVPIISTGFALIILALFLPDPNLGAKRIHVAEYMVLSLLVRFTLSYRLSRYSLLFYSFLLTSILGVHDELLQGIHPKRTYGITDMAVNTVSALGAQCLYHGLSLFTNRQTKNATVKDTRYNINLYIGWLIAAILGMAIPLSWYKYLEFPLWPFMPLGATGVIWATLFFRSQNTDLYAVQVLSFFSFLFFAYPPFIHVYQISFY